MTRTLLNIVLLSICSPLVAQVDISELESVAVELIDSISITDVEESVDPIELDTISDILDAKLIPEKESDKYRTTKEADSLAMSKEEFSKIPDSVFVARLEKLDLESPFSLDYNRHVRSRLNAYLGKNSLLTARVLGLSEMYFPMFEEALDRAGLPLELKYLAVVESALRPTARSRAGATGLWQFMYGTAKENGLEITSYIDERKSPKASTEAACKYLKHLHGMYDDWNLALAAYNSGPGNV
ncbi:MAG: lytic transglycosylase domain-containing protein, partial [Flavobacteriales bacterium]|nr:lytic transglycosylase domain-containing protein [Flavobacteriales bacterium]